MKTQQTVLARAGRHASGQDRGRQNRVVGRQSDGNAVVTQAVKAYADKCAAEHNIIMQAARVFGWGL